ncbi:MAG: hypothetical protein RLZZ511_4164 [Cyanobacteriota bacterium]|jgi:MAE_28990/MAE_18760-like HEPN
MTGIRTLEQLSDSLAEEFAWRKKELSALKSLIESGSTTTNPNKERLLLRSGVTILYAHWEGFIKAVGSDYLEFVSQQQLNYSELSSCFVALAFKDRLNQINETNKATVFVDSVEFLRKNLGTRSNIPYRNQIQTGSNLSSSIFQDIVCKLGLDYSSYETKKVLIDEKLLARRNSIAHGNYLQLDREDYLELHAQVIGMMETFRTQIENDAALENYRSKKADPVVE